jgi:hypothetical protein
MGHFFAYREIGDLCWLDIELATLACIRSKARFLAALTVICRKTLAFILARVILGRLE